MNKANESFSAFLDGEANELDVQRMLKALDEAPESLTRWHELSKVHASMHDEVVVDTALELTDADLQAELSNKPRLKFRLFQGGIAAAVAMVVVTTVNVVNVEQATTQVADAEAPAVTVTTQTPVVLNQQQFEAQQRLDLFMREHAEQASFTTGHVVVPAELEWEEAPK